MVDRPAALPARPFFSSGPCAKPPGWSADRLATRSLGRSHRSALGKARLQEAIERTHALLGLPVDYRLGIVPASDTGAMEMALWSLLGARPVTMLAWESFGAGWVTDVVKQLKLDAEVRTADYGELPDLGGIDPELQDRFAQSGLVHLLSISGFHVGLIGAWIFLVARLLRARREHALIIGAALPLASASLPVPKSATELRAAVCWHAK